ncbi:hypothetical protein MKX01_006863 [Papaver californicum]|nr:hypothetical protein MKX01_006863 [Papaver californicum]
MASSTLNLLRLPSINPSYNQRTFRKPFSSYSSATSLSFNTHRSSSSKTPSFPKLKATANPVITHKLQNPQFLHQNPNFISILPLKKKKTPTICMASSSSSSSSPYQQAQTIPAKDRLISVLIYLIPFLNGLKYGTYLFHKYYILELVFDPVIPLLNFYKSIPSLGIFVFLTLHLGIIRDRNCSRFVRFNSLQVLLMDFMLIVPELVKKSLVSADTMEEIGFRFGLLKVSHDVTFILTVTAFVYAFWKCVLGRIPEFPGVTHAVEWQIFAIDRQL